MKCSNCGRILTGEENFCRICGNKIEKELFDNEENFTDNIDVTKVQIPTKSFDDELSAKTENSTNELDAMMEIANSNKTSEFDNSSINTDEEKVFDTHLIKNDIIQNTQDLLLDNDSCDDLLLSEPTILVPNDLIRSYSKNNTEENILKEETCDEMSSDIDEEITNEDILKKHDTAEKKEEIYSKNEVIKEAIVESKTDISQTKEVVKQDETKTDEKVDVSELPDNNLEFKSITNNELVPQESKEKVKIIYKKKKNSLSILLSILFVISLFSIGYLSYLLLSSYNIIQRVNNSNIKLEDEISDLKEKNNDFEFEINNKTKEKNIKTLSFNKYILNVLDNYEYSIFDDVLNIKNDSILLDIKFDDKIKYSEIKNGMDDYSKQFTEKEYTISSHGVKVEGEREYIFYLLNSKDGNNFLAVYSMLDDDNTIGILINSNNVGQNYDDLKITNTIIGTINIDKNYVEKNIDLFTEKNDN